MTRADAGRLSLRLRLADGRAFDAADAWEAVAWLNDHALIPEADPWRFMIRQSARQRLVDGRRIHSKDPLRFLRDMAAIGWFDLREAGNGAVAEESAQGEAASEAQAPDLDSQD